MNLFGLTITRTKATPPLQPVDTWGGHPWSGSDGGWLRVCTTQHELNSGDWQCNVAVSHESILSFATVYACVTLIASDIAKMRLRLVQVDADGIWSEIQSPAFSPVLRKQNPYQTRVKFVEWWMISKLTHGNTYVLKQRDLRGVVTQLYILNPHAVLVLVAPDGSVFYELRRDPLNTLIGQEAVVVPAREIIHDVMCPLFHPLVGVSPLFACWLPALQAMRILRTSSKFFANGAQPGGVLTAPGTISQSTADRLKAYWTENFTGTNSGNVAILGDGLKYEPMTMTSTDAQLIEQLKLDQEMICSAFHVPPYMVGVGPPPNYNNIQALNQQYYSQCLQTLIEAFELVLDEGLELPTGFGTEFDLDDLLRMDSATMMDVIQKGVQSGTLAPNEGRLKLNQKPVEGGESPYLQQQYFSLEALARRDAQAQDPTAPPVPTPPTPQTDATPADTTTADMQQARQVTDLMTRQLLADHAA